MATGYNCDICAAAFNDTIRVPKLLPCQHTYCLQCLFQMDTKGSIVCPMDRKVFGVAFPSDLPDNLYIKARLGDASSGGGSGRKRFRGSTPDDSDDDKWEGGESLQLHLLANLAERREELLAALLTVRDGVLAALQERVQAEEKLLKRARDCIQCLQDEKKQSSEHVLLLRKEAASLLHAGGAVDHDLQLLQPGIASLSAEGGWQSKRVQLSEQPALQLAALQLRQQDSLEWEPSQQEQQVKQDLIKLSKRLNVCDVSWSYPHESMNLKQDLLLSTDPIHILSYVWCHKDPEFTLSLLWKHAAHLEEVNLYYAGRPHLQAVLGMPSLRKLQVRDVSDGDSVALPDQPTLREEGCGLAWLQLISVPRETARTIMAANGHSLRKLRLGVGPPSLQPAKHGEESPPAEWPGKCNDLEQFLQCCRLQRLERLTLVRYQACAKIRWCEAQLNEARRALPPNCKVRCTFCRVGATGNY